MERKDLMPWTQRGEVSRFRGEMDQLFDRFFDWKPFGIMREKGMWAPALDLSETETEVSVKAELPGMDPKEIEISLNRDILTLRGERKQEKEEKGENFHRIERSFGSFSRTVQLPAEVDAEKVDAVYKDGVLQIKLKKTEKSTSKKIEIKSA